MTAPRIALVALACVSLAGPALADGPSPRGLPLPGAAWGAAPLVSTNTAVATNVAAGIGNSAIQRPVTLQSGAPLVALDFSGRGPMVTSNVGVATNVAAGIGNTAQQAPDFMHR